jgi:hypothetical protein
LREADALFQNRKHPLETFSQKLLLFRITRHQTACAIHQQAASALVIIVHRQSIGTNCPKHHPLQVDWLFSE